jgi:hypothetical protein
MQVRKSEEEGALYLHGIAEPRRRVVWNFVGMKDGRANGFAVTDGFSKMACLVQ